MASHGLISLRSWTGLYQQILRWSNWKVPAFYLPLRQEELELLDSMAKDIESSLGETLRQWFVHNDMFSLEASRRTSAPVIERSQRLKDALDDVLCGELLRRFEVPDGLEGLDEERREYLVYPEGRFHSVSFRELLVSLSRRADTDPVIHGNCVHFLRLLQVGATEPLMRLNGDHCRALLRDQNLVLPLWRAATARPLNRRVMGSLETLRKLVVDTQEAADELLPLPLSYKILLESLVSGEVEPPVSAESLGTPEALRMSQTLEAPLSETPPPPAAGELEKPGAS